MAYNLSHNITPAAIIKSTQDILGQTSVADSRHIHSKTYIEKESGNIAADPVIQYMSKEKLLKLLSKTRKMMEDAVKALDFIEAARLRDEVFALQQLIEPKP